MQTARAYLHTLGLTKSPTGRGRFSAEAHAALDKARKSGKTFSDDAPKAAPKAAKPRTVKMDKPETPKVDTTKVDPKAVRAWAAKNGISVGARGRIHEDVKTRYLAEVSQDEQVEREGEYDVFRPGAPRTHSIDTVFVDADGNKYSAREACGNCRVSLVGCRCGNPKVINRRGTGHVHVQVKR